MMCQTSVASKSYFATFLIYSTIIVYVSANGKISGRWIDDYSCNTDDDKDDTDDSQDTKWSNCEIIYNNTSPLYHGPYSYNSSYDTLSRSFQCKYHSNLSISFDARAECLSNSKDSLSVSINNNYEHNINISNDSNCDNSSSIQYVEQHYNISNISVGSTKFALTFNIDTIDANILLSDIQLICRYIPQNRNTFLFGFSWSSFASILYFSLYVLLLCFIAISVAIKSEYDGIKEFFKKIWKMRKIYGTVLVHLYDTATDVGVMIDWWFLAQDEARGYNYESIDMSKLFWASVGFLALYRVIGIIVVIVSEDRDEFCSYCLSVILSIFDMFILRTVYVAVEGDEDEPREKQRLIQFLESIFESLPQVLLQSVFIIRGYNDPNLKNNSAVILVAASLIASVLSITNKYIWFDGQQYGSEWQDAELKLQYPCINPRYVVRVLYRFSMIAVRIISLSLIWVIFGGFFLPIYAVFSWFYWLFFILISETNVISMKREWMLSAFFSLVSNLMGEGYAIQFGRLLENALLLSVLTIFAFDEDITCGICADSVTRQASNNDYILMFIIAGWIAFVIDTILGFCTGAMDAIDYTANDAISDIDDAFTDQL